MKEELKQAIRFQQLITNKQYKEYILEFNPDTLTEKLLYIDAKDNYATALREFMSTSDYQEVLDIADKVNLSIFRSSDRSYLPSEIENEIYGEINVARCIEYYYNQQMDRCLTLMREKNTSDITDDVLRLAYAMKDYQTGDKESLLYALADLDIENQLPSPFKEEFEKLLNKYKGTEEYEYAKKVQSIEFDAPIIERPKIGMTPEEVREIWGNPSEVNRTETVYGVTEQWVYEGFKKINMFILETEL